MHQLWCLCILYCIQQSLRGLDLLTNPCNRNQTLHSTLLANYINLLISTLNGVWSVDYGMVRVDSFGTDHSCPIRSFPYLIPLTNGTFLLTFTLSDLSSNAFNNRMATRVLSCKLFGYLPNSNEYYKLCTLC